VLNADLIFTKSAIKVAISQKRCKIDPQLRNITPVLANLHWLPVLKRVIFKMAVLVWKCLHGEAPNYLADLCVPVALTEGR